VGGGLAGLACAVRLREGGADPLIVESSDAVGGRVRTDEEDGFLLDRGFQVYLSAYPVAGGFLDKEALDLRRFEPGALVFVKGKRYRLMDIFRCPQHFLTTVLQPIGTIRDKLLVGRLRLRKARATVAGMGVGDDCSTEDYLRRFGFSASMIDGFFRAFYGGIFLERELRTSSRMFKFTFKMFAEGYATLPAKGMGEIPRQLCDRLPPESVRLQAPVRAVTARSVTLENGETLEADAVVVATNLETAAGLVPGVARHQRGWRSVTVLYFSAPVSPLGEAIIALNGGSSGLVNNVCVPSDVSPHYAPEGKALVSVSVLGVPGSPDLEARVLAELESWFGDQVRGWQHLKTYRIPRALPEQPPSPSGAERTGFQVHDGIHVCGDHCVSASIEGAVFSGLRAAESVLDSLADASS
jgi:phytoene dehydrogenase-like protein